MATDPSQVSFILEQINGAGTLSEPATARRMFGEYALYYRGKVVALICDNTLFLKNIPVARALIATPEEGLPYPGARPHLDASGELDDPENLCRLIAVIEAALPAPVPRKRRKG